MQYTATERAVPLRLRAMTGLVGVAAAAALVVTGFAGPADAATKSASNSSTVTKNAVNQQTASYVQIPDSHGRKLVNETTNAAGKR